MKTLEFKVKNAGLISDLDVKFPNAGLVLVQGGNERGKSTFLKVIRTMLTASTTDNLLTRDKKIGYVEGVFAAANGDEYLCRLDLDPSAKSARFTLLTPEGKKVKAIGDVKDVFQYNEWTAEDFPDLGLTAEGGRKQAQIVLNLLPDETRKQVESLMKDESEAYTKRTFLSQLKEDKQGSVKELTPSLEDIQEVDSIKSLTERLDEVEGLLEAFRGVDVLEEKRVSKSKEIAHCEENLKKEGENHTICKREITRLLELVRAEEEKVQSILTKGKELRKQKSALLEEEKAIEKQLADFDGEKKDALEEQMKSLEADLKEANKCQVVVDKYNESVEELKEATKAHDAMEKRVRDIRKGKKELMSGKLPIEGLVIEDDILYLEQNGELFKFNTNEVAQSVLMFKTVEIFMATNKGVRMTLISRGESLDRNMMDALHKMGIEKDYLYVMEYVESGDLQVVGYEEIIKNTNG